jgi:hypothetical protein
MPYTTFHNLKAAINKCHRVMLKHQAIEAYRALEIKCMEVDDQLRAPATILLEKKT